MLGHRLVRVLGAEGVPQLDCEASQAAFVRQPFGDQIKVMPLVLFAISSPASLIGSSQH